MLVHVNGGSISVRSLGGEQVAGSLFSYGLQETSVLSDIMLLRTRNQTNGTLRRGSLGSWTCEGALKVVRDSAPQGALNHRRH